MLRFARIEERKKCLEFSIVAKPLAVIRLAVPS